MAKGNGRVDAETFVKAWLKGGTVADVALRLGWDGEGGPRYVHARATMLRRAGVKLPKLERMPNGLALDVAALNALVKGAK